MTDRPARVLHTVSHRSWLDWPMGPQGRLTDRVADGLQPLLVAWSAKETAHE